MPPILWLAEHDTVCLPDVDCDLAQHIWYWVMEVKLETLI